MVKRQLLDLLDTAGAASGYVPTYDPATDRFIPAAPAGAAASWPPGSADKPPSSPNGRDDEGDGSSTATWINTPTPPTTWDVNTTRAHHIYVRSNGLGNNFVGKLQTVPAFPFTIQAKISSTVRSNFNQAGVILAPAATGSGTAIVHFGRLFSSGHMVRRDKTTFGGTFANASGGLLTGWQGPVYIKLKVNSATSVDWFYSLDGWAWFNGEFGYNPGFTPTHMGLIVAENGSSDTESSFDFFRVS